MRVLNRSTNELVLLHMSWNGEDVWFPPIASAASSYAGMYGAPSADCTVYPNRHVLGVFEIPARMPSKDVLISYVTSGPTTNRVLVAIPNADRKAVRRSYGNFVFVVNGNGTVSTTVSSQPRL